MATPKFHVFFVLWTAATSVATCIAALTGTDGNLTKPGDSVTLLCQSDDPNSVVQFLRKGVDLANDKTGKYSIAGNNTVNKTLTVHKVGEQDLGEYKCQTTSTAQPESVSVFLYSKPVISPISTPTDLIEGEALQLTCNTWGLPVPRCTWLKEDHILTTSDPGVSFSDLMTSSNTTIANCRLTIVEMKRSDQTNYFCSASDGTTQTTEKAYVRVKDRLAAVWPSIGIVIVLILTIIIIIFAERRRRKNEAKMHPQ